MPSTVSKLEPSVSKVAWPVAGAVQRYQTERPTGSPSIRAGSPVSTLAPTVEPVTRPLGPESGCAAANASFAGPAGGAGLPAVCAQLTVTLPVSPPQPS